MSAPMTINLPAQTINAGQTLSFGGASTLIPATGFMICQITTTGLTKPPTVNDQYENPQTVFSMTFFTSSDSGVTWQERYGFGFTGGPFTNPDNGVVDPDPSLTIQPISAFTGQAARVDVTNNSPFALTLGATIVLT